MSSETAADTDMSYDACVKETKLREDFKMEDGKEFHLRGLKEGN